MKAADVRGEPRQRTGVNLGGMQRAFDFEMCGDDVVENASTMKLSMIVVITSCAPNFALSTPGTPPTTAPPNAAATMYTGSVTIAGSPAGNTRPIIPAMNPPAASWLSAPMLNNPARSPTATARPVHVSVVAL